LSDIQNKRVYFYIRAQPIFDYYQNSANREKNKINLIYFVSEVPPTFLDRDVARIANRANGLYPIGRNS